MDKSFMGTPEPDLNQLASLGRRFLAAAVDLLIIAFTVHLVLSLILETILQGSLTREARTVLLFVEIAIYGTFFEANSGQTLGKKLLKIKSIDITNQSTITFQQAAIRNAFKAFALFWLIFPSFIIAAFSKKKQRIGDRVAGTVVVNASTLEPDR